jgi:hypothetical protein
MGLSLRCFLRACGSSKPVILDAQFGLDLAIIVPVAIQFLFKTLPAARALGAARPEPPERFRRPVTIASA